MDEHIDQAIDFWIMSCQGLGTKIVRDFNTSMPKVSADMPNIPLNDEANKIPYIHHKMEVIYIFNYHYWTKINQHACLLHTKAANIMHLD
jgi:hypothetical protein